MSAKSKVVGVKQNSNGKTGTVYVESTGVNQKGEVVLTYFRWLMMRKKKEGILDSFQDTIPNLPKEVNSSDFFVPKELKLENWDSDVSGSNAFFDDYSIGEEINHLDGQTIEEAEHQIATNFIKIMLEFILTNM